MARNDYHHNYFVHGLYSVNSLHLDAQGKKAVKTKYIVAKRIFLLYFTPDRISCRICGSPDLFLYNINVSGFLLVFCRRILHILLSRMQFIPVRLDNIPVLIQGTDQILIITACRLG